MATEALLIERAIDLDARITLREFAELEWRPMPGRAHEEPPSEMSRTAAKRYSWLRKARSRGRPLPPPVGGSSRASLYRLGDLVDWLYNAGGPGGLRVDVRYEPVWALRIAASAYADECRNCAASGSPGAHRSPRDDLRHFLLGVLMLCAADIGRGRLSPEIAALVVAEPVDEVPRRLKRHAQFDDSPRRVVAARLLDAVPPRSGAAGRAARAIAAAVASGLSGPVLVGMVFRTLTGLEVRAGATTTSSGLAQLLVALGDPSPGETIVDPACGEGQLLVAAFGRQPDTTLVGRDHDAVALLSARAVLELNGARADLGDGPTDSLAADAAVPQGDLVLLDPPLGAGHAVRWLRLAARLSPRGRAVVVLPGSSLQPRRREWAELGGHTVAVIAGPPRLRTGSGEAPAIWLLDQRARSDQVAIVDASELGEGGFTTTDAEQLATAVRRWRSGGPLDLPARTRGGIATRADISARNGDLRLDQLEAVASKEHQPADVFVLVGDKRVLPPRSTAEIPRAVVLASELLAVLDRDDDHATALRSALEQYLAES